MSSNAWVTSFNSSSNARNSVKMSIFGGLQKKRGNNHYIPFSFSLFMLILYISCIFSCFVLYEGSQIQFCRSLNGLP